MGQFNPNKATTTDLTNNVTSYSVDSVSLDAATSKDETEWYFSKATQNFGYYKKIPELQKAIQALAIWTAGKGYTASVADIPILENLTGWGEDSFQSLMQNMIIVKKIVGDSFAEIMRNDKGTLINLKPISPERMKIVTNSAGRIIRYEHFLQTKEWVKLSPDKVFHLCNDRLADEIHGTSIIDACEWTILARNEAMDVYKKILKRSLAMGILYLDTDDNLKIAQVISKYQTAVNNGEVLVLPMGVAEVKDTKISVQDFLSWIQYLENFFYQAVGVPPAIANPQGFSEASSKVGFLTFEPVYTNEQSLLEQDLWAQLGIRITFNRPPSLMDSMQESEQKNTGQTGFQPKEASINMERE